MIKIKLMNVDSIDNELTHLKVIDSTHVVDVGSSWWMICKYLCKRLPTQMSLQSPTRLNFIM